MSERNPLTDPEPLDVVHLVHLGKTRIIVVVSASRVTGHVRCSVTDEDGCSIAIYTFEEWADWDGAESVKVMS